MVTLSTKRERLLDWIRNGDPADVPVVIGPGLQVAAAFLGKDEKDVTWPDAVQVAEETGTHNAAIIHGPMPVDALPFMDDIRLVQDWTDTSDGGRQVTRRIETPEGTIREVVGFPKGQPSCHREFFVKGEEDLPAFAYYIRRTTETVVKDPAVRRKTGEEMQAGIERIGGAFPTEVHVFCAAVELMSSTYMDQQTAIMTIHDNRDLMEELMDCHWNMTKVWLDVIAASNVDIVNYAINGLEWLSPDIYERYMIPQARRINDFAAAHGKLSWLHTCGKLKRIAEMRAYQRMKVNIVESLSMAPTGDIDDMAKTRRDIGPDIATRGGVNVELFYGDDVNVVKERTEYVLDSTAGFRHMLGDTNPSYPAYPRKNIQAVIDVVKGRSRLFK